MFECKSNIRIETFYAHLYGKGLLACCPVSKMDTPMFGCLLLLPDVPCCGDVRPRHKWKNCIKMDLKETGV
jgi:hypothetical protein